MAYQPDQSDKDALIVARTRGIRFARMFDGTWSWQYGSGGHCAFNFETEYHAARDALRLPLKEPKPKPLHEVMERTDWRMLQSQKATLCAFLTIKSGADTAWANNDLKGLLNWIDALQDAAEAEGFPVLFDGEPDDAFSGGRFRPDTR